MENMDIFLKVLLSEKIKIEPKYISKNVRSELKSRLVMKLEGICSKHGYIRKSSIEIYKIRPGLVELISLNGYIQYDVFFHADVCNPLLGTLIKCKVTNTNKFGILAEAGYKMGGTFYSILEVIIAKNSVSIKSDVNLEEIVEGNSVKIEVVGKKFELRMKDICCGTYSQWISQATKTGSTFTESHDQIDPDVEDDLGDPDINESEDDDISEKEIEEEETEEEEEVVELDEEEDDEPKVGGGIDLFSDEDEDVEDDCEGRSVEDDMGELDNGLNFDD